MFQGILTRPNQIIPLTEDQISALDHEKKLPGTPSEMCTICASQIEDNQNMISTIIKKNNF